MSWICHGMSEVHPAVCANKYLPGTPPAPGITATYHPRPLSNKTAHPSLSTPLLNGAPAPHLKHADAPLPSPSAPDMQLRALLAILHEWHGQ